MPKKENKSSNSQYEAFDVTVQRSPACPNKERLDRRFRLKLRWRVAPGGGRPADGKPDLHQV